MREENDMIEKEKKKIKSTVENLDKEKRANNIII